MAGSFQAASSLMTSSIIKRSLNFHICLDTPERRPFILANVINYTVQNLASSSIYEGLIRRVIFQDISVRRANDIRCVSQIAEYTARFLADNPREDYLLAVSRRCLKFSEGARGKEHTFY